MNQEAQNYIEEVRSSFNLKKVFLIFQVLLAIILYLFLYDSCDNNHVSAKIENHQKNIDLSKVKINEYEKVISQKEADILALQNKLRKVSVDFSNYKKKPIYKERIAKIIATVSIDSLAAKAIELENCIEKSKIKDTIIMAYAKKDTLFSLQKNEFQNIIDNQNEIINIHVKEILQEQKQTKKEKRSKTFWKITTAVIGGAYIYKTVK